MNFSETDTSDMLRYYLYYSDDDHLLDMIISGGEKDTTYFIYKRDSAGNVTEFLSMSSRPEYGGMKLGYNCIYDAQNRMIMISENGREMIRYNYDDRGNISYIETPSSVTRFEYDSEWRVIKKVTSAPEFHEAHETALFTYHQKDMIKSVYVESGDGSVSENRYVYDDRGLQIKVYFKARNVQTDGSVTNDYVIVENEFR